MVLTAGPAVRLERDEHHASHAAATRRAAAGLPCPGADRLRRDGLGRTAPQEPRRVAQVPETVLRRLAEKLDVPDLTEAHQVEYQVM